MNAPPILTNIMSVRLAQTAAISTSLFASQSIFALTDDEESLLKTTWDLTGDETEEELREIFKNISADGETLGATMIAKPVLSIYNDTSNLMQVNGVSFDLKQLFKLPDETDEEIQAKIDEQSNGALYKGDRDEVDAGIQERYEELKIEGSAQGQAFQLLWSAKDSEFNSAKIDARNSDIIANHDQQMDDFNEGDSTGDCTVEQTTTITSSTSWQEDLQQCTKNTVSPITDSCTVTRVLEKVEPFQNVVTFSDRGVTSYGPHYSKDGDIIQYWTGDNAYDAGSSCGQFNSTIEFDVDNINAISTFVLRDVKIDDHLALIINGTPVYGVDSRGTEILPDSPYIEKPRAFALPNGKYFKKGECYTWDSAVRAYDDNYFDFRYWDSNDILQFKEGYSLLGSNNTGGAQPLYVQNLETLDVQVCVDAKLEPNKNFLWEPDHEDPYTNIVFNGTGMNFFSRDELWKYYTDDVDGYIHNGRVLKSEADVDLWLKYSEPKAYMGAPDPFRTQTTCELSRDGKKEGVDINLKPYLVPGRNTVKLEIAVGGKGNHLLKFILKSNDLTDKIIEEPAGCSSNPKDGWGAAIDDTVYPNVGSTKRWECLDLDNSRLFEDITVTPSAHGGYLSTMFELDNPQNNICYKAEARLYQNDRSSLATTGCYTKSDGVLECIDEIPQEAFFYDSCAENNYDTTCALVSSTCNTIECDSVDKVYDCGGEVTNVFESTTEQTICPGSLPCMGESCYSPEKESNDDFAKVTGLMGIVNESTKAGPNSCDDLDWITDTARAPVIRDGVEVYYQKRDPGSQDCSCELMDNPEYDEADVDSTLQIIDPDTCNVFTGEGMSCKKTVFGMIDCCEQPTGISIADYINTYQLMDQLGYVDSSIAFLSNTAVGKVISGTYTTVSDVVGGAGKSAMASIKGGFNSVVESLSKQFTKEVSTKAANKIIADGSAELATKAASATVKGVTSDSLFTDFSLTKLKQYVYNQTGAFMSSTLGPGFTELFLTPTYNNTTGATSYAPGGAGASAISALYTIYMYYQVFKAIMTLIDKCEEKEYEKGYKEAMKSCTYVGEYCDRKTLFFCTKKVYSSCCYDSPLSRIISEQAHTQLDLNYGDVRNPTCNSLTVQDLRDLDWDRIDLTEYIDILTTGNLIPTGINADDLYDLDGTTKGLGRKTAELNNEEGAEDYISNGLTRTLDKSEVLNMEKGRDEIAVCYAKDLYGISLDGSTSNCEVCGDNAYYDSGAGECSCLDGYYEGGNGACLVQPSCSVTEEWNEISGQCTVKPPVCESQVFEETSSWISNSGSSLPGDSCDGDRYNPYTGVVTESCTDIDYTRQETGWYKWSRQTTYYYNSRVFSYETRQVCEDVNLTSEQCLDIQNPLEKYACLNMCDSFNDNEDRYKCGLIQDECSFVGGADRSTCVSGIVNLEENKCNEISDEVTRNACLGECSPKAAGLSTTGLLQTMICNVIEPKCSSYENIDDKIQCITHLKDKDMGYGKDTCENVADEVQQSNCYKDVFTGFTDSLYGNYCSSSSVERIDFCEQYQNDTEKSMCIEELPSLVNNQCS